jgi:antitoxin YefM
MNINITTFRENLVECLDRVVADRSVLHITRGNARSVVVIAEDEYESIMETLHLVRSPANAQRLLEAMDDADAGRVIKRDL